MPITAAEWYDPDPDKKNVYQGDILDGVPLVFTPNKGTRWVLLRPLPTGPLDNARAGLPRKFLANLDGALPTAWDRPDGELVMAAAAVYRVMVLSRSCNLDWKKQIHVAPVFPAADLEAEALPELRENADISRFYLPEDGEFPESYVDLDLQDTVHVSYCRRTDLLVKRLTATATLELQDSLSAYSAKPFGFNIQDPIPQNAYYRCANCFFTGRPIAGPIELQPGQNFPACERCGEDALWVKIPEFQADLF